VGNVPKNPVDFFHQSNAALKSLKGAKPGFASVGIDVPEFIEAGQLSSPISFGDKTIFAYQRMTRVSGTTIERDDVPWWAPEENSVVNVLLGEVAQTAAKIHVAGGLAPGKVDLGCGFNWTSKVTLNPADQLLLATHQQVIRSHFTANPVRLVWLHNDFGPQNIMQSDKSRAVIDWDFRAPGVAEDDLWTLAFHPTHTAEFCATYNDTAKQNLVSEKLVLAYGMLQQMRYCYLFLQDERPANKFKPETCKLLFDRSKTRVANVAERMHELTNSPVYAEAQQRFLESQYSTPTRPAGHPALPQVREALRAEK
jgi:hypothetical protein